MSGGQMLRHVIPCKGLDEDGVVVDTIVNDLEWLGHTRLIIKADNEPAIQALARKAVEPAKFGAQRPGAGQPKGPGDLRLDV